MSSSLTSGSTAIVCLLGVGLGMLHTKLFEMKLLDYYSKVFIRADLMFLCILYLQ